MKELIIIRHAKSKDAGFNALTLMNDFTRELHEKGEKHAKEMAKKVVKKVDSFQLLIASSSVRTLSTAKYFAEELDIKPSQIQQEYMLYNCSQEAYYKVLSRIDDSVHSVAIFGHNPGITHFIQSLEVARIDVMPTCGVFGVKLHTKNWSQINECKKDFWFFMEPQSI